VIARGAFLEAQRRAQESIERAGIRVTGEEAKVIEVADFGLGCLACEGAQILTLLGTDRIAVKVIVLFPGQTVPEHWHPPAGDDPGKEETIRVIGGTVHFYLPGEKTCPCQAVLPAGKESYYTAKHEVILDPGGQLTVTPGTRHWFQAGGEGAVMYSFSTRARDVLDRFTDPDVIRRPR